MDNIRNIIIKKFPSFYQDSYTTLELIRKIVNYLNECIDQSNSLYSTVIELKQWFDNLDVTDEVNAKLAAMEQDGTLANIINKQIFSELYNKLSSFVVPEMFGAKGDGVTDDSLAIQNAIDYANANKTQVKLLSKTYLVKNSLILPNEGFHLVGCNKMNVGQKYGITQDYADIRTKLLGDGDFPVLIFNGKVWSCTIEGITITNSVRHRGIGLQINNGNTWIQDLQLIGLSFNDMHTGLEINMGNNVSTHSGLVHWLVDKCVFAGNKKHGIYIRQTVENTKTWCNHNSFNNCQFSENGVGMEVEKVTIQNLNFNLCAFENNGYTDRGANFEQCFAFKAIWVSDVTFNECYFESNLPYKEATESDKNNYMLNGTINEYGNYVMGDTEYVAYSNTIRPLGNLTRGMFGDIIIDGKYNGGKVIVQDSLFSLSYIGISMLKAGMMTLRDSLLYQQPSENRRPTNVHKALFYLRNYTTNNSTVINENNVFYGAIIGVEKILELDGTLDNETILKGVFNKNNRLHMFDVSAYSIEGVNRIYVNSASGNDENIGVLPDYPLKTLTKALDKASIVKGNVVIDLNGTFPIDSIIRVRDMNVTLYGGGTANITTPIYSTSGFLYLDVLNSAIKLQNINVYLVKDAAVTGFTFNYLFRIQGNSSIVLENSIISANDDECHIASVVGGITSITGLTGNTFSGSGKLFKKSETAIVGHSGITNWL